MKKLVRWFLVPTSLKRFFFFLLSDILIVVFSLYLSFLLRFDFSFPAEYKRLVITVLPLFVCLKVTTFMMFRLYRITWRYISINDLCNIVSALLVSESLLMIMILIPMPPVIAKYMYFDLSGKVVPRSIFLIDGIISLILLSGLRVSKRLYLEVIRKRRFSKEGKRTIIIGAGNTGEMILRDMIKQGFSEFYPIVMLDDNTSKIGTYLHGVKVSGTTGDLKKVVEKFKAEAVIIAIPTLDHKTLREIYNAANEYKVSTVKIVPRIYDFHKPDINLKHLEDIRIEDLIGRQAVEIDYEEIETLLKQKTILITGAGGSIGSEIVMQVCAFQPREIVLLDIDETELHSLSLQLKRSFPSRLKEVTFAVGDVRDEARMEEVFSLFRPQIVFHAAAYKHVPMMEYNPKEAVKVNMFGTYLLAKISVSYGVEKFIMISTDKAVRPASIMGATKRMAENICKAFNSESVTAFVSVRFGNVLGSRGSVLPLFLDQLKYGGPLTVTHKDMKRYFMTIPEAVSLVMQASVIGKGGEVLVLDMGEPVRIVALAEELIRIHGLEPYKDIDIEFVGLRPGEKLFEEILTAEEGTVASRHEKIYVARGSTIYSIEEIEHLMARMRKLFLETSPEDEMEIRDMLKKYVVHMNPPA